MVSNPDVAAMSPAEAEEYVRALDRERRIVEARIATFVHQVGQTGLFAADKHRTPKAWGKAACNWSGSEAAKFVKVATMLATFDSAASLAAQGGFGVAQMHELASLVANPRVKEHLADGEELLGVKPLSSTTTTTSVCSPIGNALPMKMAPTTTANGPTAIAKPPGRSLVTSSSSRPSAASRKGCR